MTADKNPQLKLIKHDFVFQRWDEGDEAYHQELMVPALLIYGAQDKFVSLEEEQWMQEVCEITVIVGMIGCVCFI